MWIPVGTIHTDIAMTAANDKTIIAGRYEFANGTSNYTDETGTTTTTAPAKGTPILKQRLILEPNKTSYATQPTNIEYSTNSSDYHKIVSATNSQIVIDGYFYEDTTVRDGVASDGLDGLNRTAKNLQGFSESVASNGGYYIARYEASWGKGNKVKSRKTEITPLTDTPSDTNTRQNGQLWNFVTEIDAAGFCQGLYSGINSDLMNSYAWDTAIVFIQTFDDRVDKTIPYSYQTSRNTSGQANTGDNGDEVCKINDMASNYLEWTTESSKLQNSSSAYPCVLRGGTITGTDHYTAFRFYGLATNSRERRTFRPTLYL